MKNKQSLLKALLIISFLLLVTYVIYHFVVSKNNDRENFLYHQDIIKKKQDIIKNSKEFKKLVEDSLLYTEEEIKDETLRMEIGMAIELYPDEDNPGYSDEEKLGTDFTMSLNRATDFGSSGYTGPNYEKQIYSERKAKADPYLLSGKNQGKTGITKLDNEYMKQMPHILNKLHLNDLSHIINLLLTGPEGCFDGFDEPYDPDKWREDDILWPNLRKLNENQIRNIPDNNLSDPELYNQWIMSTIVGLGFDGIYGNQTGLQVAIDSLKYPLLAWLNTDMICVLLYILKHDSDLAEKEITVTKEKKIAIWNFDQEQKNPLHFWQNIFNNEPTEKELNQYDYTAVFRNPKYKFPMWSNVDKKPLQEHEKRTMNFLIQRIERASFRICGGEDDPNCLTNSTALRKSFNGSIGRRAKIYQNAESNTWCKKREAIVEKFLEQRLKEESNIVTQFKNFLLTLPKPSDRFVNIPKLFTLPKSLVLALSANKETMQMNPGAPAIARWNKPINYSVEVERRLSKTALKQMNHLLLQYENNGVKDLDTFDPLEWNLKHIEKLQTQRRGILKRIWGPKQKTDEELESIAKRRTAIEHLKLLVSSETRDSDYQTNFINTMNSRKGIEKQILSPSREYHKGIQRFTEHILDVVTLYGSHNNIAYEEKLRIIQDEYDRKEIVKEVDRWAIRAFEPGNATKLQSLKQNWTPGQIMTWYYYFNNATRYAFCVENKVAGPTFLDGRGGRIELGPIDYTNVRKEQPKEYIIKDETQYNPSQLHYDHIPAENRRIYTIPVKPHSFDKIVRRACASYS